MTEKSRLEELSARLPEKERKELLERITNRMANAGADEPVPLELKDTERDKIIEAEIAKAGFWATFLLWLISAFSGKTKKEAFLEVALGRLKGSIRRSGPGLTGYESRDLTPKFARRLYDLYLRLDPLLDLYRSLSLDKSMKSAAYAYLFERRLEEARKTVDQFVPAGEMEALFARTGQSEDVRKALASRLNDYIKSVPESLAADLEQQVQLHLALARLTDFPFATLFRYFSYQLTEAPEAEAPAFGRAPVMLTLDLLEKLFVAVSLVVDCAPDYVFAVEPIAYYLLQGAGIRPEAELDFSKVEAELAKVRHAMLDLGKEAESFLSEVPLLDLVRYFRRDPWFTLMYNKPRLYLKSLYFSALKARLDQELELRMGSIRERVIGSKVQDLLKGQKVLELSSYKETDPEARSAGVPYFTHTRSLNLLANYLHQQLRSSIMEATQLLNNTVLSNNKITQLRLSQNVTGLEDLQAEIARFDKSMGPGEADGADLARYRKDGKTDLVLQRGYKSFVNEKDREAKDLMDKAIEHLKGVRAVLDEIRTSTFDSTRSSLRMIQVHQGKNQTLSQIVNAKSESIGVFLSLLDQLRELEKGS